MKDVFLMLCVKVDEFVKTYRGPMLSVIAGVWAISIAPDAAAAQNVGQMATDLKGQAGAVVGLIEIGCYITGLTLMGVGGMNAYKKSKGDPQVTTGSIFGGLLGGGAIAASGLMVENMAQSLTGAGTGTGNGTSF